MGQWLTDEQRDAARARFGGVGLGLRWDFLDEVLAELEAGPIADIRFFEISPENYMRRGGHFPEALDRVAATMPLLTHGLTLSIGSTDPLGDDYMRELGRFVDRYDPPWHSDHLCFSGVDNVMTHDLLPMPISSAAARHVAARAREAAERLGRPLALENISHYALLGRPSLDEADFITEVVLRADCGLLLDVNNVYVNAQNYGFDAAEFIRRLPLERVAHIHVAGHERSSDDTLWIDTHGADVKDPVLALLTEVIAKIGEVPVLLERDNNVPSLAELRLELARVRAAYEAGVRMHAATPPAREPFEQAGLLRAMQRVIQDPAAPAALGASPARYLAEIGVGPADVDTMARLPERLMLYRGLVRSGHVEAIRVEIPRTAAALGERFERDAARFCDERLARSHYLRDVAHEFVAWVRESWANDPSLPSYLVDLALHELSAFDIASAPEDDRPPSGEPLGLGSRLRFGGAVRLLHYDHAVHEHADEGPAAPKRPTRLLGYRDSSNQVRYLELGELAEVMVSRLLAGATLGDAVSGACSERGEPLTSAILEDAATLLADLGERGALLGVE